LQSTFPRFIALMAAPGNGSAMLRRSKVVEFFAELPASLFSMEAGATADHWSRRLGALGHSVRLIPPAYVKPFVKRQKNDAADAEAICEAVTRPSMRFVPLKSAEQQGVLMLHRTRDLLIRQRTMLSNALRAHMAEFGIVEKLGGAGLEALIALIESKDYGFPSIAAKGCSFWSGRSGIRMSASPRSRSASTPGIDRVR